MFAIGQTLNVRIPGGTARGTVIETALARVRVRLVDGRVFWVGEDDVVREVRRGAASPLALSPSPPLEVKARVVEVEKTPEPVQPLGVLFKLFSFSGRIGRADYWKYTIFNSFVFGLYGAFGFGVVMALETGVLVAPEAVSHEVIEGVLALGALLPVWWTLAIVVKRLHDRGYSGALLFALIVPLVGPLWLFFELGFFPSEERRNRYGAVPPA